MCATDVHEFQKALLNPLTVSAEATAKSFGNPVSQLTYLHREAAFSVQGKN
jgi:poly-beta-hydroxyalkanoate depolymerase